MAPLIVQLMMYQISAALESIFTYLSWTDVAVFMLLCKLDLRIFMSKKTLFRLVTKGPSRLKRSMHDLDMEYFRDVPTERFWNAVALLKRLDRHPCNSLAPSRLVISRLWFDLSRNYFWSNRDNPASKIRVAEFNPYHDVVAIIRITRTNSISTLTCHWYGSNKMEMSQTLIGEYCNTMEVSWSKKGSFLLCKQDNGSKATLNFFRVNSNQRNLIYLSGLQLCASNSTVSSKLWLSDNSFLFPGYEDPIRNVVPWVYKIEENGNKLVIEQPERRLRKQSPPSLKNRGALTVFESGYSCQISVCRKALLANLQLPGDYDETEPKESDVLLQRAVHSNVHFFDQQQKTIATLAIPGMILAVEGQGKHSYLLYRENAHVKFDVESPLVVAAAVTAATDSSSQQRKRTLRKKRSCRSSKVQKTGPFVGNINRFACISNSSSAESSEKDVNDDEATASQKKRTTSFAKQQKLYSNLSMNCSMSASTRKEFSAPKLKLAVFNLNSLTIENQNQHLGSFFLDGCFPECSKSIHVQIPTILPKLCRSSHVLSLTENLLIIRLHQLDLTWDSSPPTIKIHLADLKQGIARAKSSTKHLFMHPTENALLQFKNTEAVEFPMSVHSCTDLLRDHCTHLTIGQDLKTGHVQFLQHIEYVVTDEDHKVVPLEELRITPAYVNAS